MDGGNLNMSLNKPKQGNRTMMIVSSIVILAFLFLGFIGGKSKKIAFQSWTYRMVIIILLVMALVGILWFIYPIPFMIWGS